MTVEIVLAIQVVPTIAIRLVGLFIAALLSVSPVRQVPVSSPNKGHCALYLFTS